MARKKEEEAFSNNTKVRKRHTIKLDAEPKEFWERFDEWMDKDPFGIKIFVVIVVLYGAGSAFYAWVLYFGGYPFKETYKFFFLSLIPISIAFLFMRWYRHTAEERGVFGRNEIFGSTRSWFMRFDDFVANDFERFAKESEKTSLGRSPSINLLTATLFLPLLEIAAALIHVFLLAVLALDWIRILSVGTVNVCLKMTPNNVSWAYVFGTIASAVLSFFFSHIAENIAMGALFGGLACACLCLTKDFRKRKYGTPYFPI